MSRCLYVIIYNFKELNIIRDPVLMNFEKKTFIGLIIENNEYQNEFCISKKIRSTNYEFVLS